MCAYNEAVLKAFSLSDVTNTSGAVTGGLAGLLYGFESIPETGVAVSKEIILESVLVKGTKP